MTYATIKSILMTRFMLSVYTLKYLISLEKKKPVTQREVFSVLILFISYTNIFFK